jgi:hypothetical protein
MKDTREFQTIKVEVEDALGRLTLNRPERLNAVGATMLQEMAEAARWFDSHRELRVVIVSGAGGPFVREPISRIRPPPRRARTTVGSTGARSASTDCAPQMRSNRCGR